MSEGVPPNKRWIRTTYAVDVDTYIKMNILKIKTDLTINDIVEYAVQKLINSPTAEEELMNYAKTKNRG